MKCILSILLFLPLFALAQPSPVTISAETQKISSNHYKVNVTIAISNGWHVYAADESLGVTPVTLISEKEKVKLGEAILQSQPKLQKDAIFNADVAVFTGALKFSHDLTIQGTVPADLNLKLQAFAGRGDEFIPVDEEITLALEGGVSATSSIKLATVNLGSPVASCGTSGASDNKGMLTIFLLGFVGGLIALLTPCVFPMVPVTVSFFTNRAGNKKQAVRNGLLYGVFILAIYLIASLPFHLLSDINPEIFNNISTNAWVNITFFIVFIFFALSFFGFFEITLPGNLTSKTANKSGLGSIGGIFFMALTLALVSFSCTGPILGSLLVGSLSSNSGAWQLTAGMGGFGAALALPFGLFAVFPNWLKSLPRSGGWMDTVKKVLAFVELALAFKFLSNADLVMHWGILKREVFIGIWLLIALAMSMYLLGRLRLPHDYSGQKFSTARKALGVAVLCFALYLVPGLTATKYANLQLLSGFPPPFSYSLYGNDNVHGKGVEPQVINDYDKALQIAKKENKPLLIDFTGWACVNCRKMEEQVWTSPEVARLINDNFVLVSLYVDDRKKLPAENQFTYRFADGKQKEIMTHGDKWSTFQAENFSQASQPLYVVLNADEQLLNHPVGYTPDKNFYKSWLNCALDAYGNSKTANTDHKNSAVKTKDLN